MGSYFIISGENLNSRDGYYESHQRMGSERMSVIIPEEVFYGFRKKYGLSIREFNKIRIHAELQECQEIPRKFRDNSRPQSRLVGIVKSVEDIDFTS